MTAFTAAASPVEVFVLRETRVQGYGWEFSRLEFLLLATILLAIIGRRPIILPDKAAS